MKKNHHLINGACGQIELRVSVPENNQSNQVKLAVVSHPHPLYGGTMNNKVVTTMEKAFASLGYHVVAYNFRGVGKSEGEYDSGEGEQDDLIKVIAWARKELGAAEVLLGGFSFGSYVTLKALPKIDAVDAICTIAPPVGLYDFTKIATVTVPWVIVQGGQDEVVDVAEVTDWVKGLENKPDLLWREKSSHFFHGELVWLRRMLIAYFDR